MRCRRGRLAGVSGLEMVKPDVARCRAGMVPRGARDEGHHAAHRPH